MMFDVQDGMDADEADIAQTMTEMTAKVRVDLLSAWQRCKPEDTPIVAPTSSLQSCALCSAISTVGVVLEACSAVAAKACGELQSVNSILVDRVINPFPIHVLPWPNYATIGSVDAWQQ